MILRQIQEKFSLHTVEYIVIRDSWFVIQRQIQKKFSWIFNELFKHQISYKYYSLILTAEGEPMAYGQQSFPGFHDS